jgi:hypothetical protein
MMISSSPKLSLAEPLLSSFLHQSQLGSSRAQLYYSLLTAPTMHISPDHPLLPCAMTSFVQHTKPNFANALFRSLVRHKELGPFVAHMQVPADCQRCLTTFSGFTDCLNGNSFSPCERILQVGAPATWSNNSKWLHTGIRYGASDVETTMSHLHFCTRLDTIRSLGRLQRDCGRIPRTFIYRRTCF